MPELSLILYKSQYFTTQRYRSLNYLLTHILDDTFNQIALRQVRVNIYKFTNFTLSADAFGNGVTPDFARQVVLVFGLRTTPLFL
jgi:hypothetical protein